MFGCIKSPIVIKERKIYSYEKLNKSAEIIQHYFIMFVLKISFIKGLYENKHSIKILTEYIIDSIHYVPKYYLNLYGEISRIIQNFINEYSRYTFEQYRINRRNSYIKNVMPPKDEITHLDIYNLNKEFYKHINKTKLNYDISYTQKEIYIY